MNFELSEDLKDIQQLCHDFAENELRPHMADWDQKGERIPLDLFLKAGELGFSGLTIPEEYGGVDLGYLATAVAIEETVKTARGGVVEYFFSGPNGSFSAPILHYGTKEQKEYFLPKVASGEIHCGMGITEPSGSSALGTLHTTAVPDGDNFIVNGQKIFITRADTADYIITIAQAPEGPVALMIHKDNPGMTIGKSENKMGLHGVGLNPIYYDDCVVPKSALLGKVGEGLKVAYDSLYQARLWASMAALGCAQAAIDLAVAYSKERMLGKHSLASFQNTQFVLADCQTKIDAARFLAYRCAVALDEGNCEYWMASEAKLLCGEFAGEVVDKCLQVFGGYGYCADYDIERIYRDVRVFRILDGASEIHKRLISKHMGVR